VRPAIAGAGADDVFDLDDSDGVATLAGAAAADAVLAGEGLADVAGDPELSAGAFCESPAVEDCRSPQAATSMPAMMMLGKRRM